jgi:hypothetical protein
LTLENLVGSKEEALKFVNDYGIVTLFPIKGKCFPSLYRATKGSGKGKFDGAWKWADELAMEKAIHYGKLVRKQVSLISLGLFPAVYRLFRTDALSASAREILDFMKAHGSASTTVLRKSLGFWGKGKKYEFAKAIDELQLTFCVAIVEREKAPKMTYTYDLIERWMPKVLLEKAERIKRAEAKAKVMARLVENRVFTKLTDVESLFPMPHHGLSE